MIKLDYKNQPLEYIRKNLHERIEKILQNYALYFNLTSRVKKQLSLEKKINEPKHGYGISGKKLQDLFGLRVNLYFSDDVKIVKKILESRFKFKEQSSRQDDPDPNYFGVECVNLVFELPNTLSSEFANPNAEYIDNTFEVQLRTIFSDGWHEIEHDFRYKGAEGLPKDINRSMNSVKGSLHMCDWAMFKLVEEICQHNLKTKNKIEFITSKFMLRLKKDPDSTCLLNNLSDDDLYKISLLDRKDVLDGLAIFENIALNVNYILVYIADKYDICSQNITDAPDIIKERLNIS